MPGDRTGVQTWPSAWDLAWEADGPKAESTLTHEGEEDDEGSGVPGGLERLAALQFPQHFLYYRLQLLRVVHLSWRVPGATCSAHQREPLRTLGSGAGPRTGLPQSSPCPFHTTTSGPLLPLSLLSPSGPGPDTGLDSPLPPPPTATPPDPDLPQSSLSQAGPNSWSTQTTSYFRIHST